MGLRSSEAMEFSGKLTDDDWKDVGVITRPKLYWLRLALVNWYGIGIIGLVVWATIAGLTGDAAPNWVGMGIIWIVIVALFAWSTFRVKRQRVREIAGMNDVLPDRIRFTSDGVAWDGPDGAAGFLPWRQFNAWREGRRVAVLDRPHAKAAVILSVASLSESDRQRVRQLLQASIAPVQR